MNVNHSRHFLIVGSKWRNFWCIVSLLLVNWSKFGSYDSNLIAHNPCYLCDFYAHQNVFGKLYTIPSMLISLEPVLKVNRVKMDESITPHYRRSLVKVALEKKTDLFALDSLCNPVSTIRYCCLDQKCLEYFNKKLQLNFPINCTLMSHT